MKTWKEILGMKDEEFVSYLKSLPDTEGTCRFADKNPLIDKICKRFLKLAGNENLIKGE